MNKEIKSGKYVKCINNNGLEIYLTKGKTYKINGVNSSENLVSIRNDITDVEYYSFERFELVETWTDKAFKEIKKEAVNNVKEELSKEIDNIKPNHYRNGEIDLIESWYLRYPFNEFKTGMVMYADRYFNRNKNNRVEDMEKGLYVMQRLKEYEIKELEKENN